MLRCRVRFEGRVQGVGFRATTRSIARDFAIVGQVRNMDDGSVELIVEGEEPQLQALIDAILHRMAHHVTRHVVDKTPATGDFGRPDPEGKGRVVITY